MPGEAQHAPVQAAVLDERERSTATIAHDLSLPCARRRAIGGERSRAMKYVIAVCRDSVAGGILQGGERSVGQRRHFAVAPAKDRAPALVVVATGPILEPSRLYREQTERADTQAVLDGRNPSNSRVPASNAR